MSRRDWSGLVPPPLPEDQYCPKCRLPKIPGTYSDCNGCEDEARKNADYAKRCAEMMGGMKGWVEYTEKALVVTDINAKPLAAVKAFDCRRHDLLLWGPRGTGKSHMVGIAKRRLIHDGVRVVTISMPDVIGEIEAAFGRGGARANEFVNQYVKVPCLSIEDVGAGEQATDKVIKFYFRLIDGRYKERRRGLLITLNDSLRELAAAWGRFDPHERVTSRLEEMCAGNIFSMVGERDWRQEKRAIIEDQQRKRGG